jgi:hypothetical protein
MSRILAALLLFATSSFRSEDDPLVSLGRLSDPLIRETSGIVRSRKHDGIFWIQSDSGNPPAIHAVRRDGRVVASFRLAAPNVDWEDIAADEAGHLYVAETGNNGNLLPLRAIYRLDEPDPARPTKADLHVVASYYRFASKDERFDAESLFVVGKEAFVIAKRRDGKPAELYSIPLDPPAPLLRPAVPRRVGVVPDFLEPATGASLSPDGRRLAVVATAVTRIYDREAAGRLTLRATVRYKERDIEAISWDGSDLILATEAGELFRIAATTWTR